MLHYVTTNAGKVREAEEYLGDSIRAYEFEYKEIQANSLDPIAAAGAREAYEVLQEPVIVDDSGLFIEALEGFPGPYSSYIEDTLGIERVGKLARGEKTTRAYFRCVIAYCDGQTFDPSPDPVDRNDRRGADRSVDARPIASTSESVDRGAVPVKLFTGSVPGRIVEPRGSGGFGYDPIFEHNGQTFAELSAAEKNALSHRGRALGKFAEWYQYRDIS